MSTNKHNLLYFEADSMKQLYEDLNEWQINNGKRLLSTAIQPDAGKFCCIALSNPSEVIICNGEEYDQASVSHGQLYVDAS